MLISVVIPTLNEAGEIAGALAAMAALPGTWETIVADGGSQDETLAIARAAGVKTTTAPCGRGSQLSAGAALAAGDAILFLHADTRLPADAHACIEQALQGPEVVGGNFRIQFDGDSPPARFLTGLYPQLRRAGLLYGDSAIFVRSSSYHEIGGIEPYPIFEDLDLVQRLKRRGRLAHLDATVVTSSRRFHGRPFAPVFARWATLQVLFWCGVSPYRMVASYPHIRGPREQQPSPNAGAPGEVPALKS